MTDRYTSQPIVGNIRVYEIFKGHRVLTERDRQMNDRKLKRPNLRTLNIIAQTAAEAILGYDDVVRDRWTNKYINEAYKKCSQRQLKALKSFNRWLKQLRGRK